MAVKVTTDEVLQQMRRSGGRITAQRRLVLDALVATQPHPSVEDVVEHVQRLDPELHRSTVYRTLSTLTDLGVISHVHLDHGRSVYHFTHDAEPHLVCHVCGAVTHLGADRFAEVRAIVADATGFDLEHGHFAWTARCAACRRTPEVGGHAQQHAAAHHEDEPQPDDRARTGESSERVRNGEAGRAS